MAELNLHYVDELIALRQGQHGGGRGAPPIVNGHRQGASVNRSCVVLLTALLQTYVEEVFTEAGTRLLPNLHPGTYRDSFARWGNPSADNIRRLFHRLGVEDIFSGLSWKNCPNPNVRNRLNRLNQIRNGIAHGREHLRVDGQPFSLNLIEVQGYRNFAEQFGSRFSAHVEGRLPIPPNQQQSPAP